MHLRPRALLAGAAALTMGASLAGMRRLRPAPSANPAKATSAAAFGGLSGLVKAAKKEGTLNVITLPNNWANYGTIIKDFTKKYGIKINSENPEGSSQDEINAVNS